MAMGERAVLRAEPHLDRPAQRCRGGLVVAGVEIPQAFGERGLRACFLREFLQLRAARDDEKAPRPPVALPEPVLDADRFARFHVALARRVPETSNCGSRSYAIRRAAPQHVAVG